LILVVPAVENPKSRDWTLGLENPFAPGRIYIKAQDIPCGITLAAAYARVGDWMRLIRQQIDIQVGRTQRDTADDFTDFR
jgi:hypothetical protein